MVKPPPRLTVAPTLDTPPAATVNVVVCLPLRLETCAVAVLRLRLDTTLAGVRATLRDLAAAATRGPYPTDPQPGMVLGHTSPHDVVRMQAVPLHAFDLLGPFRFVLRGGRRVIPPDAEPSLRISDVAPRIPSCTDVMRPRFLPRGVDTAVISGHRCALWVHVAHGEDGTGLERALTERILMSPGRTIAHHTVPHVAALLHARNGNTRDFLGRTILHEAVQRGDVGLVAYLTAQQCVDPSAVDAPRGQNALHLCNKSTPLEIIRLLLSARVSPLSVDAAGHTPLHRALYARADNALHLMCSALRDGGGPATQLALLVDPTGRNPMRLFRELTPPFLHMVAEGNCAGVRALVSHYLFDMRSVYKKGFNRRGALHVCGSVDVASLLLEELQLDLDVRAVDSLGRTPLHEACRRGDAALVAFLLTHGASDSCGVSDKCGMTPLHVSLYAKHCAVALLVMTSPPPPSTLQIALGYPLALADVVPGLLSRVDIHYREETRRAVKIRKTSTTVTTMGRSATQVAIAAVVAHPTQRRAAMANLTRVVEAGGLTRHTKGEVAAMARRLLMAGVAGCESVFPDVNWDEELFDAVTAKRFDVVMRLAPFTRSVWPLDHAASVGDVASVRFFLSRVVPTQRTLQCAWERRDGKDAKAVLEILAMLQLTPTSPPDPLVVVAYGSVELARRCVVPPDDLAKCVSACADAGHESLLIMYCDTGRANIPMTPTALHDCIVSILRRRMGPLAIEAVIASVTTTLGGIRMDWMQLYRRVVAAKAMPLLEYCIASFGAPNGNHHSVSHALRNGMPRVAMALLRCGAEVPTAPVPTTDPMSTHLQSLLLTYPARMASCGHSLFHAALLGATDPAREAIFFQLLQDAHPFIPPPTLSSVCGHHGGLLALSLRHRRMRIARHLLPLYTQPDSDTPRTILQAIDAGDEDFLDTLLRSRYCRPIQLETRAELTRSIKKKKWAPCPYSGHETETLTFTPMDLALRVATPRVIFMLHSLGAPLPRLDDLISILALRGAAKDCDRILQYVLERVRYAPLDEFITPATLTLVSCNSKQCGYNPETVRGLIGQVAADVSLLRASVLVPGLNFTHHLAASGDNETLSTLLRIHIQSGFDGPDMFLKQSDSVLPLHRMTSADAAARAYHPTTLVLLLASGVVLSRAFKLRPPPTNTKMPHTTIRATQLAVRVGQARACPGYHHFDILHMCALLGDIAVPMLKDALTVFAPRVVYDREMSHVSPLTIALSCLPATSPTVQLLQTVCAPLAMDKFRLHAQWSPKAKALPTLIQSALMCVPRVWLPLCRKTCFVLKESVLLEAVRLGQDQRVLALVREGHVAAWDTVVQPISPTQPQFTISALLALALFPRPDVTGVAKLVRALLQRGACVGIDSAQLTSLVMVFGMIQMWDAVARIIMCVPQEIRFVSVAGGGSAPYLDALSATHPLHLAAASLTNAEIFSLLLARSADDDIHGLRNRSGYTVLALSVAAGNSAATRAMLGACTAKQHVHAPCGPCQRTPLGAACWRGDCETVVAILAKYHSLDLTVDMPHDRYGNTPLMIAALSGHLPVIDVLLSARCAPGARNTEGMTCVMLAAMRGHDDVACHLLKGYIHNTSLCVSLHKNISLLHCAALGKCEAVTTMVLQTSGALAGYLEKDSYGSSPLSLAYLTGSPSIKRLHLTHLHANAHDVSLLGVTPMERDIIAGSSKLTPYGWLRDCMALSARVASKLSRQHSHQWQPAVTRPLAGHTSLLYYFAKFNFPVGVRVLADHCVVDDVGALHVAAVRGHLDVVQVLLKLDMSKLATPLSPTMWAGVYNGPKKKKKNTTNKRRRIPKPATSLLGCTPFLCALEGKHEAIALTILSVSPRDNDEAVVFKPKHDSRRHNVLHKVAIHNSVQVLGHLLSRSQDNKTWLHAALEMPDSEGRTPLEVAIAFGSTSVAMRLAYTLRRLADNATLPLPLPAGLPTTLSPAMRVLLFDFFGVSDASNMASSSRMASRLLWSDVRAVGLGVLRSSTDKLLVSRLADTCTLQHERDVFRSLLISCGVKCRVRVNMESLQGVSVRILQAVTTTPLLGKYAQLEGFPVTSLQHVELSYTTGSPSLHYEPSTGTLKESFTDDASGNLITCDVAATLSQLLRTSERDLQQGIEDRLRDITHSLPLTKKAFRIKLRVDWPSLERCAQFTCGDYDMRCACLYALRFDTNGVSSLEVILREIETLLSESGGGPIRNPLTLTLMYSADSPSVELPHRSEILLAFDFVCMVFLSKLTQRVSVTSHEVRSVLEESVLRPLRLHHLSSLFSKVVNTSEFPFSLDMDATEGPSVAWVTSSNANVSLAIHTIRSVCSDISDAVAMSEARLRTAIRRQIKRIVIALEYAPSPPRTTWVPAMHTLRVVMSCGGGNMFAPSYMDVTKGVLTQSLEREIIRLRDETVPLLLSDYTALIQTYLPTTTLTVDMSTFRGDAEKRFFAWSDLCYKKGATSHAMSPLLHALSVGWDTPLGTLLRRYIQRVVIVADGTDLIAYKSGTLTYSVPFGMIFDRPVTTPSYVASQVLLQLLADTDHVKEQAPLLRTIDETRAFPHSTFISPWRREGFPYVCGHKVMFLIASRNVLGARCGGNKAAGSVEPYRAELVKEGGAPTWPMKIRRMKKGNGLAIVSCTLPTVAGLYHVHATLHGSPLMGNPTILVVANTAEASNTTVTTGYNTVVAGSWNTVRVTTRDLYGNPRCGLAPPMVAGVSSTIRDHKNGTYDVQWKHDGPGGAVGFDVATHVRCAFKVLPRQTFDAMRREVREAMGQQPKRSLKTLVKIAARKTFHGIVMPRWSPPVGKEIPLRIIEGGEKKKVKKNKVMRSF